MRQAIRKSPSVAYADSKGPDQTAQMHSLIRAFAVNFEYIDAQERPLLADLYSYCLNMPKDPFSHDGVQI